MNMSDSPEPLEDVPPEARDTVLATPVDFARKGRPRAWLPRLWSLSASPWLSGGAGRWRRA